MSLNSKLFLPGFLLLSFGFLSPMVLAEVSPPLSPQSSQKVYGIEIRGSALFIQKTKVALNLLSRGRALDFVQRYVGVIQASARSGMKAYLEPPVYEVGMPTWNHSAVWYAGTIAHDSYHSKLYHEAKEKKGGEPAASDWTGPDAERLCLQYQLEVLRKIGADSKTQEYVRDLIKNPTYQGNPQSETDYKKRWW